MDGRVIKHFLGWVGYEVTYQLLLDSSAAKGMVQRDGVGKVKHLDVRALWFQAERRDHALITRKVPGENNSADSGTKAHPATRFVQLHDTCGIVDCGKIDEHEEIEAMAIERVEGPVETMSGRRVARATSGLVERVLLLALLAAAPVTAPVASHAHAGDKLRLDFAMFIVTFACLIFGMMGMFFLGRASVQEGPTTIVGDVQVGVGNGRRRIPDGVPGGERRGWRLAQPFDHDARSPLPARTRTWRICA